MDLSFVIFGVRDQIPPWHIREKALEGTRRTTKMGPKGHRSVPGSTPRAGRHPLEPVHLRLLETSYTAS
jgi:hypothetical protein